MIAAVLIDDEKFVLESLGLLLAEHCPDVEVIGTADSIDSGVRLLRNTAPDLVFLDVEMSDGSGFDLLERFPDRALEVIFVTAHSRYAVKAFRFSAVDYLLKPVDIRELVQAVGRFAHPRTAPSEASLRYRILAENLKPPGPSRLALPTSAGLDFVPVRDILRIRAEGRYSAVFMRDGRRFLVTRNLGEFDKLLEDGGFFRTHHSHLVNTAHVGRYLREDGGTIVLGDGTRIPLAQARKEAFLKAMKSR